MMMIDNLADEYLFLEEKSLLAQRLVTAWVKIVKLEWEDNYNSQHFLNSRIGSFYNNYWK